MKYILARIISVTALGAVLTGCAVVPGDPYYEPARYPVYGQPDVIYSAPQIYSAPPVYRVPPVIYPYSAPPTTIYYGGRDRDDWRGRDQNRGDWRERDRDRAERERNAHERDRRDQQARDANQQRARERGDQARRDQAAQADKERDRRAAEARRPRNDRDRRQDESNTMPGPNDWRARQQSNSFDKP